MLHRALIAAGGLTAAAALAATPALAKPQNLTLLAVQTSHGGSGAHFHFKEKLLKRGRRVGHDRISCTAVSHKKLSCKGKVVLKDGVIRVSGVLNQGPRNTVKITGGNGAFQGATGKVKIHDLGKNKTRLKFVFG